MPPRRRPGHYIPVRAPLHAQDTAQALRIWIGGFPARRQSCSPALRRKPERVLASRGRCLKALRGAHLLRLVLGGQGGLNLVGFPEGSHAIDGGGDGIKVAYWVKPLPGKKGGGQIG